MTVPHGGVSRIPGPIGFAGVPPGGRVPVPLGFQQVDLAQKSTTKRPVKTLPMPAPWSSSRPMRVRVVGWPISNGAPATGDVQQGAMPNCPLAAVLAAFAHTAAGRKALDAMVTELVGATVVTRLSDEIVAAVNATADDPDDRPQAREVTSKRHFVASLWKGEVHDTFYCEYSDDESFVAPVFMTSPKGVLWPLVIEKACAFHFGSYAALGDYRKHPANEIFELVAGAKPEGFAVTDATSLDKIREAASAAPRTPTIAASKERGTTGVTPWHGFAVLGVKGSTVELYDPAKGKPLTQTLEEFRGNFQVVLSGPSR